MVLSLETVGAVTHTHTHTQVFLMKNVYIVTNYILKVMSVKVQQREQPKLKKKQQNIIV